MGEGIDTPTIRGKGKAPKESIANSIYEKVDSIDDDTIISRTFYNEQGKPYSRQDYYRGSNPHTHFEKITGIEYTDHEHIFSILIEAILIRRIHTQFH